MFNSMIIATAKPYTQGTADKHGKNPVILNVLAGTCPNRTVLSGTVAEREGIEVGKSYLFQVRETATDPKHGRQFVYSKAGEVSTMEILTAADKLGDASIFDVNGADAKTKEKVEDEKVQVED